MSHDTHPGLDLLRVYFPDAHERREFIREALSIMESPEFKGLFVHPVIDLAVTKYSRVFWPNSLNKSLTHVQEVEIAEHIEQIVEFVETL